MGCRTEVSACSHSRREQFLSDIRNVSAVLQLGRTLTATMDADYWPGKRFGLPQEGPRSTPSYLRRAGGLAVDWALAVGLSVLFFDYNALATLALFIALSAFFGLVSAGTLGHHLVGIRIAPVAGGALGIVAPLIRPLLVALVLPAVLYDDDMRGGHDRLVGTILVRR